MLFAAGVERRDERTNVAYSLQEDITRTCLSSRTSPIASSEYDRGMSLGDMADRGDIDSEGSDSDDSNEVLTSISVCLFI